MRILLACLLALGAATSVRAQTLDLDELRDRLATEKDVQELRRREFGLARASATSVDAMLERGMVLIRLYQLSDNSDDAKQATNILERAVKRAPDDARPLYGLALARVGGYGVRIPSPLGILNKIVIAQSTAEILKRDPASLAKRDLKKALELDPNFASAAIELAQLSMDSRDRENMEAAAVALRRMVKAQRGGTLAAVALSKVEEALGNVEAASTAADVATNISVGTESSASAEHARGVALLRQPERIEDGARAYFAGIETLTEKTAETYYDGVVTIANAREKEDWASADIEGKKRWLKRFWNVRAAAGGITVAERMSEHFKRLATAHDKYRRESKRGAAPGGSLVAATYKSDMLPFDDRGVIYVRHGAPAEVVHTSDVDLRPNETWVYRQNGKNILYNFVVLRDGTDYRLVDDLLAALDPSTNGVPTEAAVKLLRDRQAYEPRYANLAQKYESYNRASRGFAGAGAANESAQSINTASTRIASDLREQAFAALATDSDAPDFKGDLPFWYDLYAFKGRSGLTDITAAAAIPGTSLFSQPMGSGFIYSLQASLIFIDTATSEITRKDSVFTYLSSRVLGENEHLRLTIDMTLPFAKAGVHRIVLRDRVNPGVGQLYGGNSEIKNFSGAGLMMSDIILAESEDGGWKRGDAKLGLVPPRQFEEKKPLKLFYELYNLPANAPYRTEISMAPVEGVTGFGRIRKLLGGSDGKIQLTFDGTAPLDTEGTIQELREISAEVKPGKYKVTVRVINLENQQATRSETLFIVSEKKK
jgi:GWxTD domain-containing protein